jgi:hypothetical protein
MVKNKRIHLGQIKKQQAVEENSQSKHQSYKGFNHR